MAKFLKKIGNRGFSLSELLITAGLLGFISVGVIQVIQDSNKVFTNSFTKLSTYFDQQIFLKSSQSILKIVTLSKEGFLNVMGRELYRPKFHLLFRQIILLLKSIPLKNQGDSLSFPLSQQKQLGHLKIIQ